MMTMHRSKSFSRWASALLIPSAVGASSCGALDQPTFAGADTNDGVAATSSALTRSVFGSWTDWSGLVTVTLYVCGWSDDPQNSCGQPPDPEHPHVCCTVPDTDVLVGGGAEIENDDHPGALITESFPFDSQSWFAASKDHVLPFPHRLRARALGLRLNGLSASSLATQMTTFVTTVGGSAHASTANVFLPSSGCGASGCLLVGGGGRVRYSGEGQLLYQSVPSSDGRLNPDGTLSTNVWVASAKDHVNSDTSGILTAYAIALPRCPLGFRGRCLKNASLDNQVPNHSGYVVDAFSVGASWPFALTSVGASAFYNGAGRLLTDLYPYFSGTSGSAGGGATSKDHVLTDDSRTTMTALMGIAVD